MEDLYNNTKTTYFLHGTRFLEKFLQQFHICADYIFFMYLCIIYEAHYFYLLCIVSVIYLVRQCTINDSFLANNFLNILQYMRILHCWGDLGRRKAEEPINL